MGYVYEQARETSVYTDDRKFFISQENPFSENDDVVELTRHQAMWLIESLKELLTLALNFTKF